MSRFAFLRKPLKLVLITVLMILISTAMLVFCLQSFLDGLVMDYFKNSTAYVGQIYSRVQDYPMLKDIPDNILQQLEQADTVEKVMAAPVYSAKAEKLTCVADGFGNTEALNKKLFLEGIVSGDPFLFPTGIGMVEQFGLKITSNWGGNWPDKSIVVQIFRDINTDAPQVNKGDHIFLVGRYNFNANGDANGMLLFDPEILDSLGLKTDSAIWNHSILRLPEGLSEEESASQIKTFLQETGLNESLALMSELRDMFTVHQVEEMSMLLSVADGTTFITEGRELHAGDIGSRKCVINEALARKNGLAVGDMIYLSIADSCYTYGSDLEDLRGWNSGYPFEGDTLLDYQKYGEFEIVGLYSEKSRKLGSVDYSHYSRNDIFIPDGLVLQTNADMQARSVTFRVLGSDYEDFMNEFEVSFNEQGYTINMIDTGWENLENSFHIMSQRRALIKVCAIVALIVAVLSFSVLLSVHFRYEFAVRRLMGANLREAAGIYICGFLVTAIPAGIISIASSFCAYFLWFKEKTAVSLPVGLPTNGLILSHLVGWVCIELIAVFVVLICSILITHKKSLIGLLK